MGRILLVDDEKSVRVTLSEFLRGEGYSVSIFDSAKKALDELQREAYDLVISDILLPGMTGIELLKKIRDFSWDLQVVMITGHPTLDAAVEAVRAGAFDFVSKPVSKADILRVAANALKVKYLSDQKKALEEEKQEYQKMLEQLVDKRTEELIKKNEQLRQEIDYRKHNEEALRSSEEKFRRLTETATDAIISINSEGLVTIWNDAAVKMFGYTKEEASGRLLHNLIVPRDLMDKVQTGFNSLWETGQSNLSGKTITLDAQKKDGSIIPIELSISTWEDYSGWTATGIIRDISERRNAMREIAKFKTIIETAVFGSALTDLNGKFIYVNEYWAKVHGYTRDELIGLPIRTCHTENQLELVEKTLAEINQNGYFKATEVGHRHKNGTEFPMLMTGIRIPDETGEPQFLAATAIDLTEYKQLEERYNQAQKMECVGTLAGGIAHDFNNMLTVINGHLDMALMNYNREHPLYKDLVSVRKAGKRAENLTRQLLAFSRKQAFQPKILELNSVIRDLEKMLNRLIGEDIELDLILDNSIPRIKADPGQIEQILMNLVINARDAIHENGRKLKNRKITISTGLSSLKNCELEGDDEIDPGEYLCLSVTDSGIGMSEEVRRKIFEPFFTTKPEGRGTGLGLATVHGIVKQNKGTIHIKSAQGEGSTFNIFWPFQAGLSDTAAKSDQSRSLSPGHETILIVEDEKALRELLQVSLSNAGYHVLIAENGLKAIEMLSTSIESSRIDLLVSDLVMPHMGGIEMAEQFKSAIPDIKILFTSGYMDSESGIDENANFLRKPFSIQDLSLKVRQVLDA